MKGAFGVEVPGWTASMTMLAVSMGGRREVERMLRPWVAELTGLNPRHTFTRRFLPGKTDMRGTNSAGTRGVRVWWTLESGRVYETRYRTSLHHQVRRYLTVTDDGDMTDLTVEEVTRWLSGCSASMS